MPKEWSIVAIDSLPWPLHPFRCRWATRFECAVPVDASDAECRAAVRDLALSLTPAELAECPYHQADWHTAAAAAIKLAQAGDSSGEALAAAIATQQLDSATAEALHSFFAEPIFVSGDGLGNGQHRVCAMKVARVPHCPIEP